MHPDRFVTKSENLHLQAGKIRVLGKLKGIMMHRIFPEARFFHVRIFLM